MRRGLEKVTIGEFQMGWGMGEGTFEMRNTQIASAGGTAGGSEGRRTG